MNARKRSLANLLKTLWLALCLFGAASALQAQETMDVVQNMPGFKPAMTYQDFGKGEAVNTFNGGLTVTHASSVSLPQNLGSSLSIHRVYNSKDLEAISASDVGPDHGWLGRDWNIAFGRVVEGIANVSSTAPSLYSPYVQYGYIDESGASHRLYLNCPDYTVPNCGVEPFTGASQLPTANVWYMTNDGSYIRAKYSESDNVGKWRVYFPDGSTRIAGGTNAFLAIDPYSIGDGAMWFDKNQGLQGWYVTQIRDRAGNSTAVNYRARVPSSDPVQHPYDGLQPFMGSIASIQDQFGRTITFEVEQSPGAMTNGLLKSISYSVYASYPATAITATELYSYTNYQAKTVGGIEPRPHLASVVDASQMETKYYYCKPEFVQPFNGSYLNRIDYPTGASSTYTFDEWTYTYQMCPNGAKDSCDIKQAQMFGVKTHSEYSRAGDGQSENWATWTWDRDFNNATQGCVWNENLSTQVGVIPAKTTDPMGQLTVHFFSCDVGANGAFPPGLEVATATYHRGTSFDKASPLTNAVSLTNLIYKFGGGDADQCVDQYFAGDTGSYMRPGNSRVCKSLLFEYAPNGTPISEKVTQRDAWDGFGHYLLERTTGTNITGTSVVARQYQLLTTGSVYQTDRLAISYSGLASNIETVGPVTDLPIVPPDPPGDINVQGMPPSSGFKVVRQDYLDTGAFPNAGLLYHRWQMRAPSTDFWVHLGTAKTDPGLSDITPGPTDPVATLSYSSIAQGNITQVAYAGGQDASTYSVTFDWYRGMVTRMRWGGFTYDELTREIDPDSSRIKSQTDPNGFNTTFNYDALGRLLEIAPPGEDHTVLSYPTQSYSRDLSGPTSQSWQIGRTILFYKGPGGMPSLAPPASVPGLDTRAQCAVYLFDDLGRALKTDTLMPDGSWTERLTGYDPYGQVVFSSEPYSLNGAPSSELGLKTFPLAAGFFRVAYRVNNAGGCCGALGTWTSIFSDASCSNPFGTAPTTADDFRRPLWTIKADQSRSQTEYNYGGQPLVTAVTLFNINGDPCLPSSGLTSRTTYARDVLGQLLAVTPQKGTSASYSYDYAGRLMTASLSGQLRSFAFDALGHLTQATNPENGTVTYTKYDALGNLVTYTDGLGTITKNYDTKGRLKKVSKSLSGVEYTLGTWTYDDAKAGSPYYKGRLTGTSTQRYGDASPSVQEGFVYNDAYGRLSRKSITLTPALMAATSCALDYEYDPQGNVNKESYTKGSDYAYTILSTFTHGLLGSKIFSDGTGVQTLSYHPSGSLASVTYTNGTTATFSEDSVLPRLSEVLVSSLSGVLWDTGAYSYDGVGNIKSIGSQDLDYDTFTYDELSRLQSASVRHKSSDGMARKVGFDYDYDDFGNLKTRGLAEGTDISWMGSTEEGAFRTQIVFDAHIDSVTNRFASLGRNGSVQESYVSRYDANGNLVNDGFNGLTYDPLNQVQRAVVGSGTMTEQYYYDVNGERVAVVRTNSQGSLDSATLFARTGAQVIGEERLNYGGGQLSSDIGKAYLYVGSNLAASEEVDLLAPACSLTCTATVPSSGTVGTPVAFAATATPSGCAGAANYAWVFGDGQTSTAQNPGHTYGTAGTYNWTLTVTADSATCTKTGSITIAVGCTVTCTATVPSSGTVGTPVAFAATATPSGCAGAANYAWVFGDGQTSTAQNPGHTYSTAGTYNWTLTVTADSASCTKTGSITIAVGCTVTCTATVPSSGTVGTPVAFAATATPSGCAGAANYAWAFGDGQTSTAQNPGHTYSTAGTYNWTLTVTADSATCTKTGSITIAVGCTVTCTATVPSSGTAGTSVAFASTATPSGCAGAANYAWAFGDGQTSTAQNPGHAYSTAGTYNWTLTVTADSATCTKTGSIVVATACTVSCTPSVPSSAPAGTLVTFSTTVSTTGCSGQPSFWWSYGDGQSESTPTYGITHTYASPGNYSWQLKVTVDGSTCTQSGTIAILPSYNLSGTVGGIVQSGVTVTLTGGAVQTVTTGSGGAFSFTNLPNGSYVVTPNLTGYSFTPTSTSVTINGASVSGVNFTSSAVPTTYSINGNVSGPVPSGVTMTLGGAASQTVTTGTGGSFSFSNLTNGTYTVTPSLTGYSFTPASASVTVTNGNVWGINFTEMVTVSGTVTVSGSGLADVSVAYSHTGGSGTATTNASGFYSFTAPWAVTVNIVPSKTGYAFSPDSRGPLTSVNPTGNDFTATLLRYNISGTVFGYASGNAGLSGVLVTAGGVYATTDATGSFTLPSVAPGTYTVAVSKTGLTFVPPSSSVTITTQNVAGVNFQGGYNISGTITAAGGAGMAGIAVNGGGAPTATTNASGAYTLLAAGVSGTVQVWPSQSGQTIVPASQNVTLAGANVSGVNFTTTFSISGRVTYLGSPWSGALVGCGTASTNTAADGTYTLTGLAPGTFSVRASATGKDFLPNPAVVTITTANVTGVNFDAAYVIKGRVVTSTGTALSGVTVSTTSRTATSDSTGYYYFYDVYNGTYVLTPSKAGYRFSPTTQTVVVSYGSKVASNFIATPTSAPQMEGAEAGGEVQGEAQAGEEAAPVDAGVGKPVEKAQASVGAQVEGCCPEQGTAAAPAVTGREMMMASAGYGAAPSPVTAGQPAPLAFRPHLGQGPGGGPGPNARCEGDRDEMMEGAEVGYEAAGGSHLRGRAEATQTVTKTFYYWDHLGTTRMKAGENPTPANVERFDYEPYGVEIGPSVNAGENTHKFTGHERDKATGLDYMHARYYGSSLGRFLSLDPVWGEASDPQSWNLYCYVRNNPVNHNDPTGKIIDTVLDIGFVIYDVTDIAGSMIAGEGVSRTQWGALGADVACAAVPFVAGGGIAVRAAAKGEKLVEGAKAGSKILENAAKGKKAEAAVKAELEAEGKAVLGSQVSAQTSEGRRVIDHLVDDAGQVKAVEVKSGGATRSTKQVAKDNAMSSEGATIVGKNAPADLRGKKMKVDTEVRKPQDDKTP